VIFLHVIHVAYTVLLVLTLFQIAWQKQIYRFRIIEKSNSANKKSLPINTILGYAFEDLNQANKYTSNNQIHKQIVDQLTNTNNTANHSIIIRNLLWQAYIKSGTKQTGSCTPT
jgi:hypothetical protein